MIIIARVTKDASVTTLKDERKVVNFSVAINDWYKPKGSEQGVKQTTYVNCSYWISTAIAARLTRGSLVELSGRLSVSAYTSIDGEPKGSLNFHVNSITIHSSAKEQPQNTIQKNVVQQQEVQDDLPF